MTNLKTTLAAISLLAVLCSGASAAGDREWVPFEEGVPNIVLEAMACGTPVLATPVGGIPDVIKDGDTGFIMEDNSPECIATNTVRALSHPDLEAITAKARALVDEKYAYEVVVENYRKILTS